MTTPTQLVEGHGLMQAFVGASEQALPDWLDAYLYDREPCGRWGETYRFENLPLCTHCSRSRTLPGQA